jgi:hypothetical protein
LLKINRLFLFRYAKIGKSKLFLTESEQPTRPVDLRDDGVDIVMPSREEIEGALKYLKNNKARDIQSLRQNYIRGHLALPALPEF